MYGILRLVLSLGKTREYTQLIDRDHSVFLHNLIVKVFCCNFNEANRLIFHVTSHILKDLKKEEWIGYCN